LEPFKVHFPLCKVEDLFYRPFYKVAKPGSKLAAACGEQQQLPAHGDHHTVML
jgi:hypothetical protein